MTTHYDSETDSLYVDIREAPGVESVEIAPGLVADYDSAGELVGLDIDLKLLKTLRKPPRPLSFSESHEAGLLDRTRR